MGQAEDATSVASADASGVDPVAFVRRNRWLLLGGLVLGTALGVGATFVVTPRWEAEVVVRIGMMPEWTKEAPTTVSVESPARAIERIGQAAFKDQVLARLGLSTSHDDPLARMLRDSLRPRALDRSNLVAVRVWGPSKADSERFAGGIVDELAEAHESFARPATDRFVRYLETTRDDLRQAESERARLAEAMVARADAKTLSGVGRSLVPRSVSSAHDIDDMFMVNALASRDAAIRTLKNLEFSISEVLSEERNYATALLLPARADDQRVYPRRSVFAVVGAGLGLVLAALMTALVRSSPNKPNPPDPG